MTTRSDPPQIEVAEAAAMYDRPGVRLLDVREDDEWSAVALHHAGVAAYNLTGGMLAWARSGRPVVRDDGTAGKVS